FSLVDVPFASVGMVTDAQWADLDGDGRPDLVLCGEFMPVMVFQNTKTGFVDQTRTYMPQGETGFWSSLTLADLNGDGKKDIVAGNLGLNSQIRASASEPADLLFADFDGNGSVDPFFCYYIQGKT
ncbi:RNA-binding protein, partial|nr:RNA-binding protein [Escherichia coli]